MGGNTYYGIVHIKMRIIDYYNIIAMLIYLGIVVLFYIKKPTFLQHPTKQNIPFRWEQIFFFLFMVLGIFLRFYHLATLPEGLHQDEASNSYEAFAIANYGIDRNGYPYPVYPITFGSGGGNPLLIYTYAFILKFIEPSVFSYRCIFAIYGSLTLILFFFFLKKIHGNKAALIGLGALAVMPWHVVLSRWGLDSNYIPFWCILIMLIFLYANHTKKTYLYVITAILCAIILYCYGSATFVMPFFVLFACGYSLWTNRMTWKQLIYSGIGFLIFAMPIAIFYFINVFDLPAIVTPYFSFAKFTGNHTNSTFLALDRTLPKALLENIVHLLKMLTIGTQDELWNYVPGYFTLYHFTFPITFLGIFVGFKETICDLKNKKYNNHSLMCCMLLGASIIALFMSQNINRIIFIFLPLIYFMVVGAISIGKYSKQLLACVIILFALGSVSFVKDYFKEYGTMSNFLFMKGYGDAICYAESIRDEDDLIISTYENLASPFLTALLYSRTSPHDYLETAVYQGEGAEFTIATSFTHYIFGLPEDIEDEKYKDHVIIISNLEKERFEPLGYEMTEFGNFTVLEYN